MEKKKVYFTLNSDAKLNRNISSLQLGDLTYLKNLSENYDLHIVHPREFNFNSGTVSGSYGINISEKYVDFYSRKGEHEPSGDLFFIFSDGSAHNLGLNFMNEFYTFLKNLKNRGNFEHFVNEPETEEKTLKSYLPVLSQELNGIAKTRIFSEEDFYDMISTYGSTILKPIAGCRMRGVSLLKSEKDLLDIMSKYSLNAAYLSNNYVLQEPLFGDEKRLIVVGGEYLSSRVVKNRVNPWSPNNNQSNHIYYPSEEEIKIAVKANDAIGAYVAGIDFIGSKVNELNGSGSGITVKDNSGTIIVDEVPTVLSYINNILN